MRPVRSMFAKLTRPENKRTCSPPAQIPEGHGIPCLVLTRPRSGTHLLIDLILNNYRVYRGSPLYVNADRLLHSGRGAELERIGAVVIKSHYPYMSFTDDESEYLRALACRSHVILTNRPYEDAAKSARDMMPEVLTELDVDRESSILQRLCDSSLGFETFAFEELTDPSRVDDVLVRVTGLLGVEHRRRSIAARPKIQRRRLLIDKMMTRVFGRRAPRINTGIGLGRS